MADSERLDGLPAEAYGGLHRGAEDQTMMTPTDKNPTTYYEQVVEELETVAESIRLHPELNHHSAERLLKIASDIRKDAGLAERQ